MNLIRVKIFVVIYVVLISCCPLSRLGIGLIVSWNPLNIENKTALVNFKMVTLTLKLGRAVGVNTIKGVWEFGW